MLLVCLFVLGFYLFIFRERGREGEREGEKYQCVVASHVAPTGDLAHNLDMCLDGELNQQLFGLPPMLNPLSHTSQGGTMFFTNFFFIAKHTHRYTHTYLFNYD